MILTNSDQNTAGGQEPAGEPPENRQGTRQRDCRLVSRFLRGDENAFSEIMHLHGSKLFAVAIAVVKNKSDAEEIVQDTFVRAHRGLVNFRGDSSLATWLYHIASNLARNRYWYFYRRHRQDARSLEAPVGDDALATFGGMIADAGPDPAREAAHREFSALVVTGLRRLTPCQREILIMRSSLDLPYNVIGGKLGISIGTVKSRIARARRRLKTLMLEAYPAIGCKNDHGPRTWFSVSRDRGTLAIATS
jgi:RNA polymerase sigma-70 factor (ECF subfamily)